MKHDGRSMRGRPLGGEGLRQTCLAAGALVVLVGFAGALSLRKAEIRSRGVAAEEPPAAAPAPQTFLRPGALRRGGTYEVYLDVENAAFSERSVVETGSAGVVALQVRARHEKGLTIQLGISAAEEPGVLPITVRTPLSDGTESVVEASIRVTAVEEAGPEVVFTNLPEGERIVVEGGFAHLEVAVAGNGPFVLEYGLRKRPFWLSRAFNELGRAFAAEVARTVEGPEQEAVTVALPEEINIVDVVAIDRNGLETCQSLVIETLDPCDMSEKEPVGLLETLFGPKVACADCSSWYPPFVFSGTASTDDGRHPPIFQASTCQGEECQTCCGGESLSMVSIGSGPGGYERPDGYAPPTGMFHEYGFVYPHSGEYACTVTDLSIPVPELRFAVERTFRSQVLYPKSRMGANWFLNFLSSYRRYGAITGTASSATGDMYFYGPKGRRDTYVHQGNGVFTSPSGYYDKFAFSSASCSQEIRHKDGSRYVFTETQVGTSVIYGKLSCIYGRHGDNYLQFSYDASGYATKITSSAGPSLQIVYTAGRVTRIYQIQDSSHEVLYEYGANGTLDKVRYATTPFHELNANGDLTAAYTGRKSILYEYATDSEGGYNLTKIYDGRGNISLDQNGAIQVAEKTYRVLDVAYDQSDRVSSATTDPGDISDDRVGSTVSFTAYGTVDTHRYTDYQISGGDSASDPTSTVLRKFHLVFDGSTGGLLEKTILTPDDDEVATWSYVRGSCTCNRPDQITDPLGRVETRAYDAYGNLTQRVLQGADGEEPDDDIVHWYKYAEPYYVNSSKFGGLVASADPKTIRDIADDEENEYHGDYNQFGIDDIPASQKTRYTYNATNGDLEKVEPPAFTHAVEFDANQASQQAEVVYTYNSNRQVLTRETKLAGTTLLETAWTYYAGGTKIGLIEHVIQDPDTTYSGGDLNGQPKYRTTYDYNDRRDLTTIKLPKGYVSTNVTTLVYPNGDRLPAQIKPAGWATSDEWVNLRYDANNNLVGRDVGGNAAGERVATFYQHDRVNRTIEVKTEVAGDAYRLVAGTTVGVSYSYDGEGRVRRVTSPGGKFERTEYDFEEDDDEEGKWNQLQREFVSGTGQFEYRTTESVWKRGLELSRSSVAIDGDDNESEPSQEVVTWHVPDAYGRPRLSVTTDGSRFIGELVSRDADGNVTRVEKGETVGAYLDEEAYTYGHATEFERDALGREIRRTQYQAYERDGGDEDPATASGPIEHLTKHEYAGLVEVEQKTLDSGAQSTTYAYDKVGRVTHVTLPDGSQVAYDYDVNGNVEAIHSEDREGQSTVDYVTARTYDDRNRLTEEVVRGRDNADLEDPYHKTTFAYDLRGNRSGQTWDVIDSASDVTTEFAYDGLDRLTLVTYDVGGLAIGNTIEYDDAARTVTRSDGLEQETVYTLRPELDVVEMITYGAHTEQAPDNEVFDHDRRGLVLKHWRAVDLEDLPEATPDIQYERDLLGHVTTRILDAPEGSGQEARAEYAYDYLGRVETAKTKVEGDTQNYKTSVTRTYNSLFLVQEDQLKYGTADGTPGTDFTIKTTRGSPSTGYDAGGRRVRLEYENTLGLNGATRVLGFAYDTSDRITEVRASGSSQKVAAYAYHGPSTRVDTLTLYEFGTSTAKVTKDVAYDHLRRPTSTAYTNHQSTEIVTYSESWGDGTRIGETAKYHPIFQRASFAKTGESTKTYAYDAIGRLVTADAVDRTYDEANNRIVLGQAAAYFNDSNELTSYTLESTNVSHDDRGNLSAKDGSGTDHAYVYDRLNRLVEYTRTEPNSEPDEYQYFYDAFGRRVKKIGQYPNYYFYDGDRVVLHTEGLGAKEYVHGNGIDEVLAEKIASNWYWPLVDSLGTVRDLAGLVSTTACRRMKYDFDADGTLLAETWQNGSPVTQDVLFTGRTLDRESDLYYYRARYYDPEIARFLQRDPIGVWGDPAQFGSAYSYASNDAVNLLDPFGTYVAFEGDVLEPDFLAFEDEVDWDSAAAGGDLLRGAYLPHLDREPPTQIPRGREGVTLPPQQEPWGEHYHRHPLTHRFDYVVGGCPHCRGVGDPLPPRRGVGIALGATLAGGGAIAGVLALPVSLPPPPPPPAVAGAAAVAAPAAIIVAGGAFGLWLMWYLDRPISIDITWGPPRSPPRDDCKASLETCLCDPWQPDWNKALFGSRKDCGACYRECNATGVWPDYKCPQAEGFSLSH